MPSVPAIEVDAVTKTFGTHRALDGVSLTVARGEVHALLGPNGAGKTTLLRILSGLVTPDEGAVRLLGEHPDRSRDVLGLVPAGDRSFYLRISALENLVFFARLHGLKRREATTRARAALGAVGLADVESRRAGHLSKGMQRRLAIARALLGSPAILLVDEATHDLDPEGARRVRELALAAAAEGRAVLWTTQRLEEIAGFASRVTLLDRGVERFCGSVDALMEHSVVSRYVITLRHPDADAATVAAAASAALGRADAVVPVPGDAGRFVLELDEDAVLGDVLAALALAGFPAYACRPDRSEIEEAFVALTAREPA